MQSFSCETGNESEFSHHLPTHVYACLTDASLCMSEAHNACPTTQCTHAKKKWATTVSRQAMLIQFTFAKSLMACQDHNTTQPESFPPQEHIQRPEETAASVFCMQHGASKDGHTRIAEQTEHHTLSNHGPSPLARARTLARSLRLRRHAVTARMSHATWLPPWGCQEGRGSPRPHLVCRRTHCRVPPAG